MNEVRISGRITKDTKIMSTKNGHSKCEFCIAVQRDNEDQADFILVRAYNELAENCIYHKGTYLHVEGKIRLDKWQDQYGTNRYTTYVLATSVRE